MNGWRRKCAVLAAVGMLATAVGVSTATPAGAQASVVVGVAFENINGLDIDCPFAVPEGPTDVVTGLVTCSVSASASGGTINNHCREGVSVAVGPVDTGAGVSGCTVSIIGTLEVAYSGQSTPAGTVYECGGAGLGQANYSPASGGAGRSMGGPVAMTYDNGAFSAAGAMFNVAPVTAGHINAAGLDPCGPDSTAHPFAGVIN